MPRRPRSSQSVGGAEIPRFAFVLLLVDYKAFVTLNDFCEYLLFLHLCNARCSVPPLPNQAIAMVALSSQISDTPFPARITILMYKVIRTQRSRVAPPPPRCDCVQKPQERDKSVGTDTQGPALAVTQAT